MFGITKTNIIIIPEHSKNLVLLNKLKTLNAFAIRPWSLNIHFFLFRYIHTLQHTAHTLINKARNMDEQYYYTCLCINVTRHFSDVMKYLLFLIIFEQIKDKQTWRVKNINTTLHIPSDPTLQLTCTNVICRGVVVGSDRIKVRW